MIQKTSRLIAIFLLMITSSYAVCSKEDYNFMSSEYYLLKTRVDNAYRTGEIVKDNYNYFQGNLEILRGYLDSYFEAITTPQTSESPDDVQCDSMEMQINDLVAGLAKTLHVEMPQQAEAHGSMALQKETQGPSPQSSIPTDVVPNPPRSFVTTPQQSVQTDIPPPPSRGVQTEPKSSIPNY